MTNMQHPSHIQSPFGLSNTSTRPNPHYHNTPPAYHQSHTSSPAHTDQTSLSIAPPPPPPSNAQSNGTSTIKTRSCDVCRKRKVKCDKTATGCANCAKANIQCHYPGPGRAPRRPKVGKPISARETELLKRLRRLEGVVHELRGRQGEERSGSIGLGSGAVMDGIRPGMTGSRMYGSRTSSIGGMDHIPDALAGGKDGMSSETGSSIVKVEAGEMDGGNPATRKWLQRLVNIGDGPPLGDVIDRESGKLVIDENKSRCPSKEDLVASLAHEVEEIREIVEEEEMSSVDENDEPDDLPDIFSFKQTGGHQSFIFGYSSSTIDLRPLHPLPSQIPFFWDSYVENVDPLTKIFHVPTLSVAIKETTKGWESLNPSMEAALFSIYYSVISTMSQSEVEANFNTDKKTLLQRYRFGIEQALIRADLFTTTEVVTIQAFVLFIFCLKRHDQAKLVWSLTGLAARLGVGIGLHRDGAILKLSPFEIEMRRRLWWALRLLDNRASEDYCAEPAICDAMTDTPLPLNINDSDISPDSTELPKERVGVSDMTFCLMRYEICKVAQYIGLLPSSCYPFGRMAPDLTLAEKERMVRELHDRLETKYIQYCLDAGPLCWVGATVSRLVVAKLSITFFLRGSCSSDDFPQHIRDRLFIASIELLEYSTLLEAGRSSKKWGWVFHTYVQWHAIVFTLREICKRPTAPLLERAWRAVDSVFNGWDDAVRYSRSQKNGELWMPLKRLMAKARKKREADIARGVCHPWPPRSNSDPSEGEENSTDQQQPPPQQQPQQQLPQYPQQIHPHVTENFEVLRPLQNGIKCPDPNSMPELYAAAPFSPLTWDQLANNQQYENSSMLQSQFRQFSYQQQHGYFQNQSTHPQNMENPGQVADGNGSQAQPHIPWLLEAPPGDLDIGMNGEMLVDTPGQDDFSWECIDDLVRDMQMQNVQMGEDQGTQMMGGWW